MSDLEQEITNEIFLEELKQEFYQTTDKNIKEIKNHFDKGDYQRISEIAHDIKGTAGLFGFDKGSEISNQLVLGSREKNHSKVKELINELEEYLKKNKIIK